MSDVKLRVMTLFKDGVAFESRDWVCGCGGEVRKVTYVSCVVDDHGQYLAQCVRCKDVHAVDWWPKNNADAMAAAGWVQIIGGKEN